MRVNERLGLTAVLIATVFSTSAAQVPEREIALLLQAHERVVGLGADPSRSIWPGFRPDTIPVLYVLPAHGTLLAGWRHDLPEGFSRLPGVGTVAWRSTAESSAASTSTTLAGRSVAQVVVEGLGMASIIGQTVHEQFHVLQGRERRPGRRFGEGENSFLVTSYPVFDVSNEADVALEGRLLASTLETMSDSVARQLVHQFLAVREERQRRLTADLSEFEVAAELNEGLAQYAGIRALQLVAADQPEPRREETLQEADRMLGDLRGLITEQNQSLRLRFYRTGSAQALLLDRLAGSGWKRRLLEADLTLQDALAEITRYRAREIALRAAAREVYGGPELDKLADSSVAQLRARRLSEVEEALSRTGLKIVILADSLPAIGLCGIDPQNLLQVDQGVLFHRRWLIACSGSAFRAEFNTPVVQDRTGRSLRAVIEKDEDLRAITDDQPLELAVGRKYQNVANLRLEAPGLSLRSARADVEHGADTLWIRPLLN